MCYQIYWLWNPSHESIPYRQHLLVHLHHLQASERGRIFKWVLTLFLDSDEAIRSPSETLMPVEEFFINSKHGFPITIKIKLFFFLRFRSRSWIMIVFDRITKRMTWCRSTCIVHKKNTLIGPTQWPIRILQKLMIEPWSKANLIFRPN